MIAIRTRRFRTPREAGARAFTLIEVMIAIAVLGIALIALLSLHHQDLKSVIRAQHLTTAALLAQGLMTQAEMERFPVVGHASGDFRRFYGDAYPGYRWRRVIAASGIFPTIRQVQVTVSWGPKFREHYQLTELLHDPIPFFAGRVSQPPESVRVPPAPAPWSWSR